mmetsp:Transcript_54465/g.127186  ORF Transcript_54465/g.127186 Transcript_54465/m.127186 type:complete len:792 (+) Transcript_54465:93-2468(+)
MGLAQCVGWCSRALVPTNTLHSLQSNFKRIATDRDHEGMVDLMNEIVQHQWPFMDEWFRALMKAQVEPQLAKLSIQGFLEVRLGETVTLGNQPFKFQVQKVDTFQQESTSASNPHEPPFMNIIVFSVLDWQGNAVVDVRMGGNVELTLHSIRMKGVMILELVKMSSMPPWFSGMRLYMPDQPELDMQIKSKIFGNVINFHGESVAFAVRTALLKSLSKTLVLPNCFAASVGDRIDNFNAKAIRPEGVLRIGLLSVVGLEATASQNWLGNKNSRRKKDPEVEVKVSLGALKFNYPMSTCAAVPSWGDLAVMDYIVTRPNVQMAKITLKEESWQFSAEAMVSVKELIEDHSHNNPDRRPVILQAADGSPCFLEIATEWKVASQVEIPRPWSLGPSRDLTGLLVVDIFHATNLPREGRDVTHWVAATFFRNQRGPKKQEYVKQMASEKASMEQVTQNSVAKSPAEQGLLLLRKLRLSADLQRAVGVELERDDHQRTLVVAEKFWKERMRCRQSPEYTASIADFGGSDIVDVALDYPCYFHLDRNKCGRIVLNVYRRRNKGEATNNYPQLVGSAEMDIQSLDLAAGKYTVVSAPLHGFDGHVVPTVHFRVSIKSLDTSYRAADPVTFNTQASARPKKGAVLAGLQEAAQWLRRQRRAEHSSGGSSSSSSNVILDPPEFKSASDPAFASQQSPHPFVCPRAKTYAFSPEGSIEEEERTSATRLKSPSMFGRSPRSPGMASPSRGRDQDGPPQGSVGSDSTETGGLSGSSLHPNNARSRGFRSMVMGRVQRAKEARK